MDDKATARAAIRDFLITRRARITPAQAGLPAYGTNRRVKGLRREEVALLAGISSEYYTRLERGLAAGASPGVIEAVANALRLNEDEREHLSRLLTAITPQSRKKESVSKRRAVPRETVRPGIQVLLDALNELPAFVFNARLDVVGANALGRALYAPVFEDPVEPANIARFMFLDESRAREFWLTWETMADDVVAMLRTEAGHHPGDPALVDLIGQLSTRSDQFRTRWAAHNVRKHKPGVKIVRHPLVGELTLPFEDLHVDAAPDQLLMVYTPEPGSPAHDGIQLLASWNAEATDRSDQAH